MKTKLTLITFLFFIMLFQGYSQSFMGFRKATTIKDIPKKVRTEFKKQYTDASVHKWYITHLTYWQNDMSSNWYTDWFGRTQKIDLTYDKPTYFEVEFTNKNKELSRAIYNMFGFWYETRSQVKELPENVKDALNKSKYNAWIVSKLKEKIESPGWPFDVYRFKVSKGSQYVIIKIDESGNIIQTRHPMN
ncbi:hypothetical protein ACFLRY_02100 [Bacteroidota bacterium]